jgi:hypothetical protein
LRYSTIRELEKRLFSGILGGGEEPAEICLLLSLYSLFDFVVFDPGGSFREWRFVVLVSPCFFRGLRSGDFV